MANTDAAVALAAVRPVTPVGDAGLFDVDPDQDDLTQNPDVAVTGDVDALPEDMEV